MANAVHSEKGWLRDTTTTSGRSPAKQTTASSSSRHNHHHHHWHWGFPRFVLSTKIPTTTTETTSRTANQKNIRKHKHQIKEGAWGEGGWERKLTTMKRETLSGGRKGMREKRWSTRWNGRVSDDTCFFAAVFAENSQLREKKDKNKNGKMKAHTHRDRDSWGGKKKDSESEARMRRVAISAADDSRRRFLGPSAAVKAKGEDRGEHCKNGSKEREQKKSSKYQTARVVCACVCVGVGICVSEKDKQPAGGSLHCTLRFFGPFYGYSDDSCMMEANLWTA